MKKFFRKQYIVDRKFQWAIIGFTLVVSLLTTVFHLLLRRMESVTALPLFASLTFFALFELGILILAVLISNRIAGPLFRMSRHLREAARGKPLSKIYFRAGDYFSDLNKSFNQYVESLGSKDNDKGFTLAEVMVTVGIVSILSAMAYTSLSDHSNSNYRFKGEVLRLSEALQTARNAAVAKNQCAFVTISNPQTVTVRTYAIPSPCSQMPLPAPDFQQTFSFNSWTSISNFNSGATLIFRPSGGLITSAPATVTVAGEGFSSQLTIYPAIGQVRRQ